VLRRLICAHQDISFCNAMSCFLQADLTKYAFYRSHYCIMSGLRSRYRTCSSSGTMLDLLFVATTLGFFAIAIAYVWGCVKL
jgi:hypothetical protein